jgi:2-amino-4-hydroxy-6-hydroxymethyldihydropteridine diphosphokinase
VALCYIGLGANSGEPLPQLRRALTALHAQSDLTVLEVSALYHSPPMGPQDQPDYLNAVASLRTPLAPEALLDILQAREAEAGRRRDRRWGPRPLDLDLLLYGDVSVDTTRLRVPHPGLGDRAFVLLPLCDLVGPDFPLPGGQTLAQALQHCGRQGTLRLPDALWPGARDADGTPHSGTEHRV